MELGLQQVLVGEVGLVFGDEGWREGAAKSIFDHFIVLSRAQEHADRWTLVGFADITSEEWQLESADNEPPLGYHMLATHEGLARRINLFLHYSLGVLSSGFPGCLSSIIIQPARMSTNSLEFVDLQLERNEALQLTVIEQQIEAEIFAANLQQILLTDKGEIATKFEEEAAKVCSQGSLQIGFRMLIGQVKKVEQISILEQRFSGWM